MKVTVTWMIAGESLWSQKGSRMLAGLPILTRGPHIEVSQYVGPH